jgi:hypothetical protein
VEARFRFKVEVAFRLMVQARSIAFPTWEIKLYLKCVVSSVHHGFKVFIVLFLKLVKLLVVVCWCSSCCCSLQVFIVLFLIANFHSVVEIHCVVTIVHHVTFPFYGKYYPYLYIVLQVEISLEVKSQWLQGFNKKKIISSMFILLKL